MSKKQSIPFGATLDEFREKLADQYSTLLASNGEGIQLFMVACVGPEANTEMTFIVKNRDAGDQPQASRAFYELVTA